MGNPSGDNLQYLWRKALKEYEDVVGSPPMDDSVKSSPQVDKEGVIRKSIESVGKVANCVASAVSPIFGQAQTVVDALNYLAGTVNWYNTNFTTKNVFQQLKEVTWNLDRISDYMKALEYGATIEPTLFDLITRIMVAFLQLCTIYAKVKKDSAKFSGIVRNGMRSMIRWDGGIATFVEEIKNLTNQELILNVAALRMSDIYANESRLRMERAQQLRESLNLNEVEDSWLATQTALERKNIPRMGDWLLPESDKFASWANISQRPESPVLWITGPPGSGKSHLCSRAIQLLKSEPELKDRSRQYHVSTAWFYFQKGQELRVSNSEEKGMGFSKDKRKQMSWQRTSLQLRDALVAIIWQLAESDKVFQKFAVDELRKAPQGLWTATQLWKKLIHKFCEESAEGSKRPHRIIFLVIDGNDEPITRTDEDENPLNTMIQDVKKICGNVNSSYHVRILFSSQRGSESYDSDDSSREVEIQLPRDSRHFDPNLFMLHHLAGPYTAWTEGTRGHGIILSLQSRLTFMFSKRGNYHVLRGFLEEIKRTSAVSLFGLEELESKLRLQDENHLNTSILVPGQLEKLNRELGDDEKKVLNEIMILLVHLKEWPSVEQLEAFLFLRRKRNPGVSVEAELREKYPQILTIQSNGTVEAAEVQEYFLKKAHSRIHNARRKHDSPSSANHAPSSTNHGPSSTGHSLTHSHLDLTKDRTIVRPKVKDYTQSHMVIIQSLLHAVCSEDHEGRTELKCLHGYTGMRLLWHLWRVNQTGDLVSLNDPSMVTLKEDIGKHLAKFFMDERTVESWMSRSDPVHLRTHKWHIYVQDALTWIDNDLNVGKGFRDFVASTTHSDPDEQSIESESAERQPHSNLKATGSNIGDPATASAHRKTTGSASEAYRQKSQKSPKSATRLEPSKKESDKPSDRTHRQCHKSPKNTSSEESSRKEDPEISMSPNATVHNTDDQDVKIQHAESQSTADHGKAKAVLHADSAKKISKCSLLPCVIKASAFQWLQSYNWDASDALRWLITIAKFAIDDETTRANNGLSAVNLSKKNHQGRVKKAFGALKKDNKMSLQQIEQVEDWAKKLLRIESTHSSVHPIQDVRIAQTLFGMNVQKGHEEAERRCELALHRDSSYLQASLCLSRILEYNGKKRRALQEILRVREYLQSLEFRETDPESWNKELKRFWHLCDVTNSVEEALATCKGLSDQFSNSSEYVQRAWKWIERAGNLQSSFRVLSMIREVDGHSLLTALLHSPAAYESDFHQHLCFTLNSAPHLVLKAYMDAILDVKPGQQALHLRHWYGVSLFYQGKTRDALYQLRSLATDMERSTDKSSSFHQLFVRNAEQLGSVYIELTRNDQLPQTSINQYIEELKGFKDWIDHHRPYEFNYLNLLLGRFYHLMNHHRKANAAVRAHMDTAFRLLEDDREDNDWKGHFMLAEALLPLDDEHNVRAAWSLIATAPFEERVCELSITCAGRCGWSWNGTDILDRDLYICRDCAHVHFEEDCLKKLWGGSLKERVCRKDHRMTRIPRLTLKDRRRVKLGNVLVGKVEMDIDDWLAKLRSQYGIRKGGKSGQMGRMEFLQIARWKL